jgi:hypothetical protein
MLRVKSLKRETLQWTESVGRLEFRVFGFKLETERLEPLDGNARDGTRPTNSMQVVDFPHIDRGK